MKEEMQRLRRRKVYKGEKIVWTQKKVGSPNSVNETSVALFHATLDELNDGILPEDKLSHLTIYHINIEQTRCLLILTFKTGEIFQKILYIFD